MYGKISPCFLVKTKNSLVGGHVRLPCPVPNGLNDCFPNNNNNNIRKKAIDDYLLYNNFFLQNIKHQTSSLLIILKEQMYIMLLYLHDIIFK